MHRVVVVPAPTPNKPMSLEYFYDFNWDPVAKAIGLLAVPSPVVRVGKGDVYRDTKGMGAESFGPFDFSPRPGLWTLFEILTKPFGQSCEFPRNSQ